jgi:hypothetical protein
VDDVVKISRSVKALEEELQELDNKAHKTEVTVSQDKTNHIRVRIRNQFKRRAIGGYRLGRVSKFSLFNLFASGFKWLPSTFPYDILFARRLNFSTRFTKNINIPGTKQD